MTPPSKFVGDATEGQAILEAMERALVGSKAFVLVKEACHLPGGQHEGGQFVACDGASDAGGGDLPTAGTIRERLANWPEGDKLIAKLSALDKDLPGFAQETAARQEMEQTNAAAKVAFDTYATAMAGVDPVSYATLHGMASTYQSAIDKAHKATDAYVIAAKAAEPAHRELAGIVSKLLQAKDPLHPETQKEPDLPHVINRSLDEGRRWLMNLTENPGIPVKPISYSQSAYDSSYMTAGATTDTIALHEGDPTATAVHEHGHYLEFNLPGVMKAAQEFGAGRTKDETPTFLATEFPFNGFTAFETGKKDNFDVHFSGPSAYYVGKTYPDGATETISMGTEALYKNGPKFARDDPEYCKLILAVLKGKFKDDKSHVLWNKITSTLGSQKAGVERIPAMIVGTLTFSLANNPCTATLDNHGVWQVECPHAETQAFVIQMLTRNFDYKWHEEGPSQGRWGGATLAAAARFFQGKVSYAPGNDPPGLIY